MPSTHIKFYTLPVCPKCKVMRARLKKIQDSNPHVTVEELGLKSYIDKALKKRIMDAPIIMIKNKTYSGIVDEEIILSSL
jgi:glutaredoxin